MVVITKGTIHAFAQKHAIATMPLNDWYNKTKKADWKDLVSIKQTFNSVDFIGNDRYVFNIGGNNIRMIAMIHFDIRTLYIRAILTHREYDNLNLSGSLKCL